MKKSDFLIGLVLAFFHEQEVPVADLERATRLRTLAGERTPALWLADLLTQLG